MSKTSFFFAAPKKDVEEKINSKKHSIKFGVF
jgi:hypothetical protein